MSHFWVLRLSLLCCDVLSSFLLRLRPVVSCITRGRSLTVTFARVLARAHVDGPGFPPTDTLNQCQVRALLPTLAVLPHACHRRVDCLRWLAHAARHGYFLSDPTPSNIDPKIGDSFTQDMAVFGACCNACVTSRRAQV